MTNSIIFKIFLLLYLAIRGLVIGQELSLECGIMTDRAKSPTSYTLEISSNTSDLCKYHSIYLQLGELLACLYQRYVFIIIIVNINYYYYSEYQSYIDNTDTGYNGISDNCTISCTDMPPSNEKILMIALTVSVTILTVLLGIVIMCWIGTYRTMKKKILRALQTTATTAVPTAINR